MLSMHFKRKKWTSKSSESNLKNQSEGVEYIQMIKNKLKDNYEAIAVM